MAHKAFKRAANLEPVWFTLPGRTDSDDDIRFECNDEMAAGVVLAFAETMGGEDDDDQPRTKNVINSVHDLFNSAVVDEQHDQFWELINDRKSGIGISLLIEVAQWLSEEYSARPTGQSSEPGPPEKRSGNGSTGGALREVQTYSRPKRVGVTT